MTKIAEAKREFSEEIDAQLDEIGVKLAALIAEAREAAHDCKGLNGLRESFNGLACTLETAESQLGDIRTEQRAWLGASMPEITEYTSTTAMGVVEA